MFFETWEEQTQRENEDIDRKLREKFAKSHDSNGLPLDNGRPIDGSADGNGDVVEYTDYDVMSPAQREAKELREVWPDPTLSHLKPVQQKVEGPCDKVPSYCDGMTDL